MRVHAVRHEPLEDLGHLATALGEAGIAWSDDDPAGDAAALVVMGGPMSVNDELESLRAAERAIERAMAQSKPVLGICLGSQLIARVLGAPVSRAAAEEVGWYPVSLTPEAADDVLFHGVASPAMTFHWHEDAYLLPPGAVRLAWSDGCEVQAFRYGANVYGLQFHPEVPPATIDRWCVEDGRVIDAHAHSTAELAATIFGRWCALVRGKKE